MRWPIIPALAATASLCGCVDLAPRYVRPAAPVPAVWRDAVGEGAGAEAGEALSLDAIFADSDLQRILAQATVNNRDLRIAGAAIASARAQARIAEASRLPQIDATLSAATQTGAAAERDRYAAGLDLAQFEIDLFGRLRNLSNAAFDRSLAAEAAAAATRLALVSSIASAYYALATDRTLLALARANQVNGRNALDLTTARFQAGFASDLDVRQARTILDQAESDEQDQETLVSQDRNALDLLVGMPVDQALLPPSIEAVEAMIAVVPAGIGSAVLLQRPDVVQAELLLRADDARIGAARAALFPSISLTSAVGTASTALGSLLGAGGSGAANAGGAALLPVFDGGARRANLADVRAQRAGSLARYEQAIQRAFRDVGDALARERTIERQVAAQQQLVADAEASATLTEARYRAGIESFLDTLVSQRAFYAAQRSLAQTRQLRALNRVALFASLGGDQRQPRLASR